MSELQKYINDLKTRINQKGNLSEIEIIRYIYIDLGKKMNFDLRYTFGNSKEKEKLFNKKVDDENLEKIMQTRIVICKNLSYLMERILKEFDVNISTYTNYKSKHVYNIVTPKEGKKYIIDLEEDLEYIQCGAKTHNFGIDILNKREQLIDEEELRRIDVEKVDYIPEGYYFEDIIWMLKKAISNPELELKEKLEMVLQNLNVYADTSKMHYRERIMYYTRVIKNEQLFLSKELNNIFIIDMCKKDEKEIECKNFILLRIGNKDQLFYVFDEYNNQYRESSMKEIADLVKEGYKPNTGIIGLKGYLQSKKDKADKER